MEAPGEGESFDVQIKIGEMVYQLQSDTGYFPEQTAGDQLWETGGGRPSGRSH